jgi:hypothetical protein
MHSGGLEGTHESKDLPEVSLRGRIVGGPWVGIPFHCQLAGPLRPAFFVRHVASVSRRAGFNRRTVAPVNTVKIDVPSDLQPAHCGQHAFALGTAMANWPTLPGAIGGLLGWWRRRRKIA